MKRIIVGFEGEKGGKKENDGLFTSSIVSVCWEYLVPVPVSQRGRAAVGACGDVTQAAG
jgi:hypothetical protein